jgi:hypothetical protein
MQKNNHLLCFFQKQCFGNRIRFIYRVYKFLLLVTEKNMCDIDNASRVPIFGITFRGKHSGPLKNMCPWLHLFFSTGLHLLCVQFTRSLPSNSCKAPPTSKTTKTNTIIRPHRHKFTSANCVLNWNSFVTARMYLTALLLPALQLLMSKSTLWVDSNTLS